MKLTPIEFSEEGVSFQVTFAVEVDYVVATLHAPPDYQLLGSVLTMAWKTRSRPAAARTGRLSASQPRRILHHFLQQKPG